MTENDRPQIPENWIRAKTFMDKVISDVYPKYPDLQILARNWRPYALEINLSAQDPQEVITPVARADPRFPGLEAQFPGRDISKEASVEVMFMGDDPKRIKDARKSVKRIASKHNGELKRNRDSSYLNLQSEIRDLSQQKVQAILGVEEINHRFFWGD